MHRTQLLLLLHIPTIWHCVHLLMSAFTLCCVLGYPRTTGRIHTAAMSPSSGCCIKTEDSFSMIPASAFPLLFTWLMQCGGSCSFCQSIHLNILHGFSKVKVLQLVILFRSLVLSVISVTETMQIVYTRVQ